MSKQNGRKMVYQNYYEPEDYAETLKKLPDVIHIAEKKSFELMEPTIYEQREIINIILDYIRGKERKIYGGTAINELIKMENPADAIYDDYHLSDIDFYSPSPIVDLVELCNLMYEKKFKHINGKEAQHDESYAIYVNWRLYCNISYVPKRVYAGIKTIPIDGIKYVDPHFIWIDQLRICTSPMVDSRLWEKTFKRQYVLLKYYPPEVFDTQIQFEKLSTEISDYFMRIKQEFLVLPEIEESTMINGMDAYNFYMRYASGSQSGGNGMKNSYKNVAYGGRNSGGRNSGECNIPFLELSTINYFETVSKLYEFVKKIVGKPDLVSITEYFPLFQFIGYSVMIQYEGNPLVMIHEISYVCIPMIKASSGIKYAAYQYLLMSLLMNKFRAHLDHDKQLYFNYGVAISNLISTKKKYLWDNKLSVINNSAFSEFRVPCMGTPISQTRLYMNRKKDRKENGKRQEFMYSPDAFFKLPIEAQQKFDPNKAFFKNTSGNIINNVKNLRFKIEDGQIVKMVPLEDSDDELDITTDPSPEKIDDSPVIEEP